LLLHNMTGCRRGGKAQFGQWRSILQISLFRLA
jgi:hypothetical protein